MTYTFQAAQANLAQLLAEASEGKDVLIEREGQAPIRLAVAQTMGIQFTAEQDSRLREIATQAGTYPERLVMTAVERYLDEETRFLAAVDQGIAAAERGEFLDEDEMDARVEAMLRA